MCLLMNIVITSGFRFLVSCLHKLIPSVVQSNWWSHVFRCFDGPAWPLQSQLQTSEPWADLACARYFVCSFCKGSVGGGVKYGARYGVPANFLIRIVHKFSGHAVVGTVFAAVISAPKFFAPQANHLLACPRISLIINGIMGWD